MKSLILLLFISFNLYASCEQAFKVKSEKDKDILFCEHQHLQLSQTCSLKAESCTLYKDLQVKVVPQKVLDPSITGNPGSRICNSLGWKVHMASLFDESQVCTCLHPGGEYITCSSLSEYYQEQAVKAKK